METQMLLDKLSECLTFEQCGLQLYRVVESRAMRPELKRRYREFGEQTAHHRDVLVTLISALGGDPNYVSPTARLVQFKSTKLLESALVVAGLAAEEVELSDLENVWLAETKCHGNWALLSHLAEQAPPRMREPLQQAVGEVEQEEDEHVRWAHDMHAQLCLQAIVQGPALPPERWQTLISAPLPPIETLNPSPIKEGLLAGAGQPMWQDSLVGRAMRGS
jgi:hypothetical protein